MLKYQTMKHLFRIVLLLPLVSACDPITLGLGLGGGYVASREMGKSEKKQERAVDRRIEREEEYYQQKDQRMMAGNDQQIAEQMSVMMMGGGLTNVLNVSADVRGGRVTLYGTAPSPTVADRAVDIARRTPGVTEVVSRINIMEMTITPTGKTWGHVARPPARPQQQMPPPPQATPQIRIPAPVPPEGAQVPSAVPPQPIEPQPVGQLTPRFTPLPPETVGTAPLQPMPQPPYIPPQPAPPGFTEPQGTNPRTLPQVEGQKPATGFYKKEFDDG